MKRNEIWLADVTITLGKGGSGAIIEVPGVILPRLPVSFIESDAHLLKRIRGKLSAPEQTKVKDAKYKEYKITYTKRIGEANILKTFYHDEP